MPSERSEFSHRLSEREFIREHTQRLADGKGIAETAESCLFELKHGDTVIRIADDWDGHVLIERLYVRLREARKARDKAAPLTEAGPMREEDDTAQLS